MKKAYCWSNNTGMLSKAYVFDIGSEKAEQNKNRQGWTYIELEPDTYEALKQIELGNEQKAAMSTIVDYAMIKKVPRVDMVHLLKERMRVNLHSLGKQYIESTDPRGATNYFPNIYLVMAHMKENEPTMLAKIDEVIDLERLIPGINPKEDADLKMFDNYYKQLNADPSSMII